MESSRVVLYPEDIARETGLGLNLVYRQLRTGKIPAVRVGDRWLISRVNFEKWLNGGLAC